MNGQPTDTRRVEVEKQKLLTDVVIELWNAPEDAVEKAKKVLEAEINRLDAEVNGKKK